MCHLHHVLNTEILLSNIHYIKLKMLNTGYVEGSEHPQTTHKLSFGTTKVMRMKFCMLVPNKKLEKCLLG